jgi:hypothetical protein
MPRLRRARLRTAGIAAAVALLHALILMLLARPPAPTPAAGATPRVTLRLLPGPETDRRVTAPGRWTPPEPRPIAGRRAPALAGPVARGSTALAGPAAPGAAAFASGGATAEPGQPNAPPTPASHPERALDLTLRRGFATRPGARNPALDDPRSNTAGPAAGERMATTLGSDPTLVEESLGQDGRRRLRRGNDCVVVTPSRIAQLRPFDEAAARTPSLVAACP